MPPNPGSPNAIARVPRALPAAASDSAGQAEPRARPNASSRQGAPGPCFRAGGWEQTPRAGVRAPFLTDTHPRAGTGCPLPASPRGCWEAPVTGNLGQDGHPPPGCGGRGAAGGARRAPAVPEGLSAGAEQAASLLHDCIFRAGHCEALVPSSSLSALGRWMSPGRTVPSAGSARCPPAPHRRDPGYLASRSHW